MTNFVISEDLGSALALILQVRGSSFTQWPCQDGAIEVPSPGPTGLVLTGAAAEAARHSLLVCSAALRGKGLFLGQLFQGHR